MAHWRDTARTRGRRFAPALCGLLWLLGWLLCVCVTVALLHDTTGCSSLWQRYTYKRTIAAANSNAAPTQTAIVLPFLFFLQPPHIMATSRRNKHHDGRRRRRRRRRVYSPPVKDDDDDTSSCALDCGSSEFASFTDTATSGCSSPQELVTAASAKRFDTALFAGVNEVAQDLQELFLRGDDDENDNDGVLDRVCMGTSSSRGRRVGVDDSGLEPLCYDHFFLDFFFDDCEKTGGGEHDDDVEDSLGGIDTTVNTTLSDSFVTKGTLQSNACTVETTEIETFLDSRWTPTLDAAADGGGGEDDNQSDSVPSISLNNNHNHNTNTPFRLRAPREAPTVSSLARKTILMQRHVVRPPDVVPSMLTVPARKQKCLAPPHRRVLLRRRRRRNRFFAAAPATMDQEEEKDDAAAGAVGTDPTTNTAAAASTTLFPSPPPKGWDTASSFSATNDDDAQQQPTSSSPTSVVMLLDNHRDDDDAPPPGRRPSSSNNSSTTAAATTASDTISVGTHVHSNAREEAIAHADAMVRAMVQQQHVVVSPRRRPPRLRRGRRRPMFCKMGEI